jgi:hypothetical protein
LVKPALLGPATASRLVRAGVALAALMLLPSGSGAADLYLGEDLTPTRSRPWEPALVEAQVDNLDELLRGCEERQSRARERERQAAEWLAHQGSSAVEPPRQAADATLAPCTSEALLSRLQASPPGVWAMTPSISGGELFATVNLPMPALLASVDGGATWRWRHLFAKGYNIDRGTLVRGLEYRHGLLVVASEDGVLLSRDAGHTFELALAGKPITAVAISASLPARIFAGGNATSFLSVDGGATWSDLGFSAFTRSFATNNRYVTDHITAVDDDPLDPGTFYVGTGSHLYSLSLGPTGGWRWQAMEGDAGGRVHDDSTVYNVEVASRFMISTCNGVYWLARKGGERLGDQADVSWRKFRDGAFANRSVGGPKGNLRSYYVAEDPTDAGRVLVADFAGLYEGVGEEGAMRWRRVTELPFYSPSTGYPEYTAIAWTSEGGAVVGSRYRGIFVQRPRPGPPPSNAGASCFLN